MGEEKGSRAERGTTVQEEEDGGRAGEVGWEHTAESSRAPDRAAEHRGGADAGPARVRACLVAHASDGSPAEPVAKGVGWR